MNDENIRKQVYNAFKLACIHYKPSPVLYRGHKYNRRALIEAKRTMLDTDWQLIMKFQPFKRLWGEDSDFDFYEQFNQKLKLLIKGNQEGGDMDKFGQDIAMDTFVKIMEGTNIFDMKRNSGAASENSIDEEYHRMSAQLTDEINQ